jgi:hypothetical protein
MNDKERADLAKEINRHYRWFSLGSRLWSMVHHGSLYLAAVLSASTALILKLELFKDIAARGDIAAILAAFAALLGTLAATGGFQRKWRSNRINRGDLDQLRVDFMNPQAQLEEIRTRLKEILARHTKIIVGQD